MCNGTLANCDIKWSKKAAVCVVMSAGGYPAKYEKGNEILGLDKAENENVLVFHAGTAKKDGKIVTMVDVY